MKVPYYMSMDGFLEEALSKMGYGFSHLYTLSFPNGRSFIGPHHVCLSSLPSSPPPPLLQILISLQLAENNKTNKKLSTFGITPGMITPLSYDHMPFKLVFEDILLPPLSIYLSFLFHLSSPPPSLPLSRAPSLPLPYLL